MTEVAVEITEHIIDATREIFSTMVMMEVSAGEPILGNINPLRSSITGMVGLAGTSRGMLAIHIPIPLAQTITGNFLGLEVADIDEDVKDAIGELANMLCGNIKTALTENGKDITLSLPSTICGTEYFFHSQEDIDLVVLPFTVPAGEFLVELRLQKQS